MRGDTLDDIVQLLSELPDESLTNVRQQLTSLISLNPWIASGKPVPPPDLYKHQTIKAYAKEFGIETFVETGT